MKKINNYILLLISFIIFYSCKTQSFISRKYTSGNYVSFNEPLNKTQIHELEKTKLLVLNHTKEKSLPFIITKKNQLLQIQLKLKMNFLEIVLQSQK